MYNLRDHDAWYRAGYYNNKNYSNENPNIERTGEGVWSIKQT